MLMVYQAVYIDPKFFGLSNYRFPSKYHIVVSQLYAFENVTREGHSQPQIESENFSHAKYDGLK
jgi:hypothetical protein